MDEARLLAQFPGLTKVTVARTFLQRARGLIGRQSLAPGEGLLIPHCNCIHTFLMRFAIDATFLDRQGQIVKVVRNIRPGRPFVWGTWRAVQVLETAAAGGDGKMPRSSRSRQI